MHHIKYFITGGGTGGHIYPAIAVIDELIKSGVEKKDIYYVGNKNNLEFQIATGKDLNFLSYNVSGMPRKLSFKLVLFFIKLFCAVFAAFYYVIKYKPGVIFATGGYVCAPVLFAAKMLKIPYVLHDCDAHPGIVSRLFSSGANSISLAFESAKEYTKCKKPYFLGNPIREDFKTLSKTEARRILHIENEFTILIMGGSSGAKKINDSAIQIIEKYKNTKDVKIIWQTGKKNFDEVKNKLIQIPQNLILRPYFENMTIPLIASDVAISRAGSLSLSELCAAGLPSLLVPYPYAAANHQRINAKKMCELGASVYLDDNDCNGQTLLETLEKFISDKEKLAQFAKCAKNNAKYDAAFEIVKLIKQAVEEKNANC